VSSGFPNPAIVPPGAGVGATPVAPAAGRAVPATSPADGPSFADVLAQSSSSSAAPAPRFSRHALERVNRRGIDVDGSTLQRLTNGVSQAASKGSRDSVVFVDNTAFVVSVPNNTVITAVGSEHLREHVFTNIDSAVIA
jgi:flagellar operon protein